MIDTIKFHIPIKDPNDLQKIVSTFDRFKKENLETGFVEFEFHTTQLPLGSYNRTISIKETKHPVPAGLFMEFSVPKYEKGNNVEMIRPRNMTLIVQKLYQELCTKLDYNLPHHSTWSIYRLDICYNWIFKDSQEAELAMSFIQRIDYPRKQKYIYNTSVMYKGSSFTIKFYLKGPEFYKHDFKEMDEDTAIELQTIANKILRFEISIKKTHLKQLLGWSPVYVQHIEDEEVIETILSDYLRDKVFRYITTKTMVGAEAEEILYSKFPKNQATRYYQFYKSFYYDEALKNRITKGGMHRSTIYRYKKILKDCGIGFDIPESVGRSILEQLIIPSSTSKFDLLNRQMVVYSS